MLGSALDLDELLGLVMDRISDLVRAERSTLFLVDRQTGELWSKVAQGSDAIRLPPGSGLAGHVADTGAIVNVADAYADPRFNAEVDRLSGFQTVTLLAAPLRGKDGTIIGVAQALNKRAGETFGPEDERALAAMCNVVGIALENAQLVTTMRAKTEELERTQERLRRKVAEVDLLFEIEREISHTAGLDALIDAILERAMATVHAGSAAVLLVEGPEGLLHVKRRGTPAQLLVVRPLPTDGPAGRALSGGEPEISNDSGRMALVTRAGLGAGAVATAALVSREQGEAQVVGVLELVDEPGRSFTEEDLKLAAMVAGQLARAVTLARNRAETERAGRLAALGQMLSGIVHDLRSPMTVIGGYSELMSREPSEVERDKFASIVLSQIDQVNAMTREVLAFVRGERQVLLRRVMLGHFWSEMKATLGRELESRRVALHITLDYDGVARLDEGKIRRLVTNLARNAAQAMPDGGRFTVRCDADGDVLVLEFGDDGPGLPPQVLARLFSTFNSRGKTGGTGLGLAIVKEAVESHGGVIACRTGPGQGTTFTVRLPGSVAS